jgi:hypothetical protein
MLDHEKLDVYQCSISFLSVSIKVIENMPKGYAIAEGCGKLSNVDNKQRFHSIARGSAMECGAILDVCHALQVVDPSLYQEGKNLLV